MTMAKVSESTVKEESQDGQILPVVQEAVESAIPAKAKRAKKQKPVEQEPVEQEPVEQEPVELEHSAISLRAKQIKDKKQEPKKKKDYDIEEEVKAFIRIGTEIWQIYEEGSQAKDDNGKSKTYTKRMAKWNRAALKDDYGAFGAAVIIDKMQKAVAEVTHPDHINYQEFIPTQRGKLLYNKYEPIPFKPKEGNCDKIKGYLKHIFCFEEHDQLEEGLDYLTILYKHPMQKLPILALVSKERETAKTTFLNFLIKMFGNNAHFLRGIDLESNFNDDWTGKLCVCLDDVDLRKKEITDRIKSVATASYQVVEGKGKARTNEEFFGKLIITSNHYDNFAFIDNEENRYWVRYVPKPQTKYEGGDYLQDEMVSEIPAFLHFLLNRPMKHPKPVNRMWLPYDAIYTKWLGDVKANSASVFERELVDYLKEMFEALPTMDQLSFRLRSLIAVIKERSGKKDLSESYFKKIVKDRFNVEPEKKSSRFDEYLDSELPDTLPDGSTIPDSQIKQNGKALIFTRQMLGLPILEKDNDLNKIANEKKTGSDIVQCPF